MRESNELRCEWSLRGNIRRILYSGAGAIRKRRSHHLAPAMTVGIQFQNSMVSSS
jgi:hypothetical protein